MNKTVKFCPVCKYGIPKLVYYAPPAAQNPELWEESEFGYEPLIWLKRLECKNCGATVPGLVMTVDDAIGYWNDIDEDSGNRYILQRCGEEEIEGTYEVE